MNKTLLIIAAVTIPVATVVAALAVAGALKLALAFAAHSPEAAVVLATLGVVLILTPVVSLARYWRDNT